jgi:hypothetical protein
MAEQAQFEAPVDWQDAEGNPCKSDFSFTGHPGFDVDDGDWQSNLKAQPSRRRFPNSDNVSKFRAASRYGKSCWVRNSRGFIYKV